MHLRTHLWTSLVTGVALYPRNPRKAALVAMSGVLIDYDHILLYALRSGDWSISGAMRYNHYRYLVPHPGDNRPRFGQLRSYLHHPLVILLINALGYRQVWFRPIAAGMTLHLLLDHLTLPLQWLAVWRAHGRCQHCGVMGKPLQAQRIHSRQPFTVLCKECERAFWLGSAERRT